MGDAYYAVAARLPRPWCELLGKLPEREAQNVTEIRLRSGCPLCLTQFSHPLYPDARGALHRAAAPDLPAVSHSQLQECFIVLCRHSVFSYEQQLCQGFFTLPGGHRVGIAAQAAYEGSKLLQPKNITSLNLRIARVRTLDEPGRWRRLLEKPIPKLLIAGVPGSGKTTVLRSLAQLLSDDGKRVSVLDERCELFPVDEGGFCFPQPANCDVLSGYPKTEAIGQALRSLSPELFLCDELRSASEAALLLESLHSGVGFIATVHAGTREELAQKPTVRLLTREQSGLSAVLLSDTQPGKIQEILNEDWVAENCGRRTGADLRCGHRQQSGPPSDEPETGAAGCSASAAAGAGANGKRTWLLA